MAAGVFVVVVVVVVVVAVVVFVVVVVVVVVAVVELAGSARMDCNQSWPVARAENKFGPHSSSQRNLVLQSVMGL